MTGFIIQLVLVINHNLSTENAPDQNIKHMKGAAYQHKTKLERKCENNNKNNSPNTELLVIFYLPYSGRTANGMQPSRLHERVKVYILFTLHG